MAQINIISINNQDLLTNVEGKTFLASDAAAAAGTISVDSINRFAINQILLVGDIGQEGSEIILTHASSAPSGTTITLASNLVYAHSRNTPVYIIDYNRYELSNATTATGSKTTLTTDLGSGLLAIDAEHEYTIYKDTEYSTGYYFVRKKETIGNTFSNYSDAIPVSDGFATNTVGYAIEQALRPFGGKFTDDVTHAFLIDETNLCLKYIQGKQLRWPKHRQFNYATDQTVRGQLVYDLPTDIYEKSSNKSIISVRIGDNDPLIYQDPVEFDARMNDVKYTQVTTAASATDTTLAIDNSYDFDDDGTVNVYVSGTKYSITYTGVTRSATAGVLTGIPASGTGSITVAIAADTYVWQDEDEGEPVWFTVRNEALEIQPLADGTEDNKNIYIDYWTVATEVDSDGDTLDTDRFDMIVLWLKWKIRSFIKNDGKLDYTDGDFLLFKEMLNDAIRNKGRGLRYKMQPAINKINYKPIWRGDTDDDD